MAEHPTRRSSPAPAPFVYDKRRLRAQFERAAPSYDEAAVLPRTVADRLVERLDVVRLRPQRILDAGCGTGYGMRALARRYRKAQVVGLDLALQMALQARRKAGWFARARFVCGDAERLPFADAAFELVSSNLMLQWCDPATVFPEFLRVLRPEGLLMFTSLGPDTLKELRAAWREADVGAHVHEFPDMHDVGDALVRAGFTDPVMDVEHYTLTYPDVQALARDLRALGGRNAQPARGRGLTGRARHRRFQSAYEALARERRIPTTWEIVYGHAWVPRHLPHRRPVIPVKAVASRHAP